MDGFGRTEAAGANHNKQQTIDRGLEDHEAKPPSYT